MRVRKLLKITVVLVGVAALVCVLVLAAVRIYLTPERLGAIAQSVAARHLATDIRIGSISPKLFRSVEVRAVEIAQPVGFEGDPLASLDRMVARFRLLPLLRRRLEIVELTFDSPRLALSRSADGEMNVLAALREEPPPAEPAEPAPADSGADTGEFAAEVRSLRIRTGEVQYVDESSGVEFLLGGLEANLKGDMTADGKVAVSGDVSFGNLSAESGDEQLVKNLAATSSFDVAFDQAKERIGLNNVRVTALDTSVELSGTIAGFGPDAAVRLDLSTEIDADSLMQHIGTTLPAVSLPVRASGTITVAVKAEGTVQKPKLSIEIDSPEVRVERAETAEGEVKSEPSSNKEGGRRQPGPFELGHIDARLDARCGRFEYDTYEVEPVELTATLEDNKFRLSDTTLGIAQGTVSADSTVDLGVAGFEYTGAVSAEGVDIGTLLGYVSPKLDGTFSGTLASEVKLAGHGTDLDDSGTDMDGRLTARFVDGHVRWPALIEALGPVVGLRNLDSIPVVAMDASVEAGRGTVRLSPLVIDGPDMRLEVDGTVSTDLALDMAATVRLSRELTRRISSSSDFQKYATQDGQLVVPLTVSGTVAGPKLLPDVQAAAAQAIEKGREVLKEQLERELDKVAPELGEIIGGFFKRKRD